MPRQLHVLHHGCGQPFVLGAPVPPCPSRLTGAGCGWVGKAGVPCAVSSLRPCWPWTPSALGWWGGQSSPRQPDCRASPCPVPGQAELASAALAVALGSLQVTQIYRCGRQDPEGEPGGHSPKTATYRSLLCRNYPSTHKSVCKDSTGKCLSD